MVGVVLRGGVVVVVVVVVALDVGVGEEERGRGRWRLLGRCHAHCQGPIALDGAIPAGSANLGRSGEDTRGMEDNKSYLQVERDLKVIFCAPVRAYLARSPLLMLLDRSSSLSYRRGLSKKYALELKLWLLIIPPGAWKVYGSIRCQKVQLWMTNNVRFLSFWVAFLPGSGWASGPWRKPPQGSSVAAPRRTEWSQTQCRLRRWSRAHRPVVQIWKRITVSMLKRQKKNINPQNHVCATWTV